ncbi:hypothetical protein C2E23DRAFT_749127, partial [Lenzites betulinus]
MARKQPVIGTGRKRKQTGSRHHEQKVRCSCCQQLVSTSTALRHRKLRAAPHIRASHTRRRQKLQESTSDADAEAAALTEDDNIVADQEEDIIRDDNPVAALDNGVALDAEHEDLDLVESAEDASDSNEDVVPAGFSLPRFRKFRVTVEDGDDEDDEPGDDDEVTASHSDLDDEWDSDSAEDDSIDDEDIYNPDLSARDRLHGQFMHEAAELVDQLSDADRAILRAFAFRLNNNLTEEAFAQIPYAFPTEKLPTYHKIKARVAFLAGIKAEVYDCCPESCMAYTGPLRDLQECSYCQTSRLDDYGNPRRQFSFFPVQSRLTALSSNRTTAEQMTYRADYVSDPSVNQDVFDGTSYQNLCMREVVIDGKHSGYRYFSDRRDIALGMSTDGFAPWRRRKKT